MSTTEITDATEKSSDKSIWFVAIILISLLIGTVAQQSYKESKKRQEISDSLITIAETIGLKNVKITVIGKPPHIILDCSNMDEISNDKKIFLDMKISETGVHINEYKSNGHRYSINTYKRIVFRNGEEIYNDYERSKAHTEAKKSKKHNCAASGCTREASYQVRHFISGEIEWYCGSHYLEIKELVSYLNSFD